MAKGINASVTEQQLKYVYRAIFRAIYRAILIKTCKL